MTTATTAHTGAVSAPSTLAGTVDNPLAEPQPFPGSAVPRQSSSPARFTAPRGTSAPDASSLASGASFPFTGAA